MRLYTCAGGRDKRMILVCKRHVKLIANTTVLDMGAIARSLVSPLSNFHTKNQNIMLQLYFLPLLQ